MAVLAQTAGPGYYIGFASVNWKAGYVTSVIV
jgi:hypothetical protein